MKRWYFLVLSALVLFTSYSASAFEMTGGIIENKRFPLDGKHEIMLQFPFQIGSNFTDSKMIGLQYMYHPWEFFSFGIDGAYAYIANESSTLRRIRQPENAALPGAIPTLRNFPIDLDRRVINYYGGLIAHWYPIYGRWSIAGSYDLSWDIFLQLGGYMMGYKTYAAFWETDENMAINESAGGANNITAMKPAGNFGAGFRFHFWDYIALRFEYKGYLLFDQGVQYITSQKEVYADGADWQAAYDATVASGDTEANTNKMLMLNYLAIGIVTLF